MLLILGILDSNQDLLYWPSDSQAFRIRPNYPSRIYSSPAWRWQIVGLLSFYSTWADSYNKSATIFLYLYQLPIYVYTYISLYMFLYLSSIYHLPIYITIYHLYTLLVLFLWWTLTNTFCIIKTLCPLIGNFPFFLSCPPLGTTFYLNIL